MHKFFFVFISVAILVLQVSFSAKEKAQISKASPIIIDSDTLFYIEKGIGVFSAQKRADEINSILKSIVQDDSVSLDSINIIKQDNHYIIAVGNQIVMGIYPYDVTDSTLTVDSLAAKYSQIILSKLQSERTDHKKAWLLKSSILTLVFTLLLVLGLWLLSFLFPRITKRIETLDEKLTERIQYKKKKFIKHEYLIKTLKIIWTGLKFALTLVLIYIYFYELIDLWPFISNLNIQPIIKGILLFVFYTVLAYTLIKGINTLVGYLNKLFISWKDTKIKSVKIRSFELLSADRSLEILSFLTKVARFVLFGILFYTYVTIVFSLFEFTETWADTLLSYILDPLTIALTSFLKFLPNLFFIIVLSFVFYYIIKLVRVFFNEIDKGTLELPGFYKEWAMPTFKIVRFLILVLAAIIIFPYLPGSDSPFFQGISVFLGILFSLGSSSAIANMVSGIVLTYMRPFKIGDRVKIAETTGDVVEKNLLVTRVRTIKNVDITIPNAMVLSSHIINFSSSASQIGLILHTTVTIGYDVPWQKVHELLLSACDENESILKEPKPFVLQTSLDDFYVSYELNVYTNDSNRMAVTYSQLHSAIQDKFNQVGVEIMSPHYSAVRDGNQTTIPEDYLPKNYKSPSFKIFGNWFGGNPKSE